MNRMISWAKRLTSATLPTSPNTSAGVVRSTALHDLYHHTLTRDQLKIRVRLSKILAWHTRPEDMALSDRDFILEVYRRWQVHQGRVLIDPNE